MIQKGYERDMEAMKKWKEDKSGRKYNLIPIPFSDMTSKSYLFEVTKRAQQDVVSDNRNKDYIPMIGDSIFNKHAQNLLFQNHISLIKDDKIATVETVSGTSALRILLQFFKEFNPSVVYLPNVSWNNHLSVAKKVGLLTKNFPFFNFETKDFDFKGMRQALEAADEGSIVLLNTCSYNISGVEPSLAQWKELALLVQKRKLFAVFDCAAQGIASGEFQRDIRSIQIFLDEGIQVAICQSLATCLGMYGEMIGALHVVCKSKDIKNTVQEQLKLVLRTMYSNPPCNGGWIATKILENQEYKSQWIKEVSQVARKNVEIRRALYKIIKETHRNDIPVEHIIKYDGPFLYLELSNEEINNLRSKYHIYISENRFLSLENLKTDDDIRFILHSINEVIKRIKPSL